MENYIQFFQTLFQQLGIFDNTNRESLINFAHTYQHLLKLIDILQKANLINQVNINALTQPGHNVLLTNQAWLEIWSNLNEICIHQINFQKLLTASIHNEPMDELHRLKDDMNREADEFIQMLGTFLNTRCTMHP